MSGGGMLRDLKYLLVRGDLVLDFLFSFYMPVKTLTRCFYVPVKTLTRCFVCLFV